MNRKLLVSLLRKNIEELDLITQGFMEMNEYPLVIIKLAQRKTEDIQSIIEQLAEIKTDSSVNESKVKPVDTIINNDSEVTSQTATLNDNAVIKPVEAVIDIPVVNNPEIDNPTLDIEVQVTEKSPENKQDNIEIVPKNDLSEKPEITEPDITAVVPLMIEEPEIETIELEKLVEQENNKIKSIEDLSLDEDLDKEITLQLIDDKSQISVSNDLSTDNIENGKENKLLADETRKITIAEKMVPITVSRNEKLSKADNSINATLANKKINDIKQAISIGDRFRFQRELFNGNGEDMNKTLHYINQLASFEEVNSFLKSKYNWNPEDEAVEDFNQIVKRRFN